MELKSGYKQTEAGTIPEDWTPRSIRSIATAVASGRSSTDSKSGDFPVYGSTGIIGRSIKFDYAGRAILIARVGANAGKLSVVDGKYGVTDNTIILRIGDSVTWSYVWRQLEARRLNTMVFGSGQPLITGTQIKNVVIPLPTSKAEQEAIAEALNDADALIESLEQLIVKKSRLKRGAMQELLTGKKRLARFDGAGWKKCEIGELPSDWRVTEIGQIASVKTGPFGSSLHQRDYVDDGTPIITVEHLGERGVTQANLPMVSDVDRKRLISYSLEEGDIVFSRVGSVDRNARVSSAEHGWLFSGRLLRLRRSSNDVDTTYLSYHFHSEPFKQRVRTVAVGQTMASLNTQILRGVLVALPPLTEQTGIAAILSDMDTEIAALETKLAKAHQLKQGMMQELLTGRTRLL